MLSSKALKIFSLPKSATAKEINARYRSLAKEAHKSSSPEDTMRKLNAAKEALKEHNGRSQDLVPVLVHELTQLAEEREKGIVRQGALEDLGHSIQITGRQRLDTIRGKRDISGLCSLFSAAAAFGSKSIAKVMLGSSEFAASTADSFAAMFETTLFMTSAMFAVLAVWLQRRMANMVADLDEAKHILGRDRQIDLLLTSVFREEETLSEEYFEKRLGDEISHALSSVDRKLVKRFVDDYFDFLIKTEKVHVDQIDGSTNEKEVRRV